MIKVLFFDLFGTVVDWRSSIITQAKLMKFSKIIKVDWEQLVINWRLKYQPIMEKVNKKKIPWKTLDELHEITLNEVCNEMNIRFLTHTDKKKLKMFWHKLDPWSDSCEAIKKLEKYLPDNNFMLTYGDGVSNVNIKKLLQYHKDKNKIVTLTAVNPPARFGALKIKNGLITKFKEKIKLKESWINGGYFVINKKIFKYIKSNETYFEKEPLEKLSKENNLAAYKHHSFWQCMDTKRDRDFLEIYYKNNDKKK